MTFSLRQPLALAFVAAAVAVVVTTGAPRDDLSALPIVRVATMAALPETRLPGGGLLGGISDLAVAGPERDGWADVWVITDRGPNGTADRDGVTRRTLLEPGFVPCIVRLSVPTSSSTNADLAEARVIEIIPLAGVSGRPMNGRPNGVGRDEPMLGADGDTALAASADGVDTEGLVPCGDGFWAAEEYRPSLLRIGADGRIEERHVPADVRLPHADTRVIAGLPAAYGDRRDNRGFEALAASPDGTRLYALLQSPLDHPAPRAAKKTGNVRMLVVDADTGRPIAEHVYRLGDPADPDYHGRGCPPDDGKLCAMAALADHQLVVLEQADGGVARLYRVTTAAATDTLGRAAAESTAIEGVRDLAAAGIEPVDKQLIADLGPLLERMRHDVFGGGDPATAKGKLKLEGLAVLDDQRLLLVNDNDFGVHEPRPGSGATGPRTCFWVVSLPGPLLADHDLTTSP